MEKSTRITATAIVDAQTQWEAVRVHLGNDRLRVRAFSLVAAAVLFPIGAWLLWTGSEVVGLFLLIIAAWGAGWAVLDRNQIRRRVYRNWQQVDLGEKVQVHYEISQSGLRMEDKEGAACVAWSKFRKWREGRGLILAYRTDDHYWTIPVSQFDTVARDAVRAHLAAHCPRV